MQSRLEILCQNDRGHVAVDGGTLAGVIATKQGNQAFPGCLYLTNFYNIVQNCKFLRMHVSSKHCVKCVQIWCFFWSIFFHIRTEYGEILRIPLCSVRMRENTDQKKLRILDSFHAVKVLRKSTH